MNRRKFGSIQYEGDELYYKITGEGEPLLIIAGSGGCGDLWLPLADKLSDQFMVITYDRRSNGRSSMNNPDKFDISQQSRDAVAILKSLGINSSHILGSGSGGVITLDIATYHPEVVKTAIVHEAPVAMLHFESAKLLRFFRSCYNCSFKLFGNLSASFKFLFGLEIPAIDFLKSQLKAKKYLQDEPLYFEERRIPSKLGSEYVIKQEILPIINYNPNIETLINNNCKIVVTCGDYAIARGTWFGDVSRELASLLLSELIVFPGHHGSFMDNPSDWARDIKYILTPKTEDLSTN